MSCTGSAPTFTDPSGWSLVPTSCSNAATIHIDAACGSSGYTVKLIRTQNAVDTVVSTQSIPNGPFSAMAFSYTDTPPCGYGTITYRWEIYCDAALQSTSYNQSVSQGGAPTVDGFTLGPSGCSTVASVHVNQPCGNCSGTLKLYREFNGPITFSGGEVIYTTTVPAGPTDATYNYTDTPPCDKGTWHYAWKMQWDGGSVGTSELTADGALPATLNNHQLSADNQCNITNQVDVTQYCGSCAATVKLYRKLNSAPAGDPGEIVYTNAVPAGAGVNHETYTEKPGDGHWYYEWKVYDEDGNVDDALPPKDITVDCAGTRVVALLKLPTGQFEKQIVLVQVTGSPAGGLIYNDVRVLNLDEQRLEWWYHRNGGCAAFRLLTHELLEDSEFADSMDEAWELHVRIKLGGEDSYSTWYRGIVKSIKRQEQGTDVYADIRGYGYIEMMNNIMVQRQYPAGLTVKQIVDDIMATDVVPWTRIIRPHDMDITNGDSGVDPSPYVIKSPLHFECTALEAVKFLAELQGSREYGIDAQRRFYFRASSSTVGANFYLQNNVLDRVAGGKLFGQTNSYKVAGKSFGARDYLRIREDVTDATTFGRRERPVEIPWVTGDMDASAWADNIIALNKSGQEWSVVTAKSVDRRLDKSHPLPRVTVYGADMSNDVKTYDFAKVQYVEGGAKAPLEIREKGVPKKTPDNDQPLKAQYYLGRYPNDLIDELKENFRSQIEALKGRHKQFRYPNDITNLWRNISGRIPGEIKHMHLVPDYTNINLDVTNTPQDLTDPTNPRGVLMAWIAGQWTKISLRRTFTTLTGVRGLYIGEVVSLITDMTNGGFGELRWWDGTQWQVVGTGSGGGGGGGGASLGSANPQPIAPNNVAAPGVSTFGSHEDHVHAVPTGTPVDITNADAAGTANTLARSDHQHRGILTVKVKGQADIFGYVDITAGQYITVRQSGQTLTIDATDLINYVNSLALAAYNPITDPVFWALMG